eukprot:1157441-Pelagomonas_calceolata.AAC.13
MARIELKLDLFEGHRLTDLGGFLSLRVANNEQALQDAWLLLGSRSHNLLNLNVSSSQDSPEPKNQPGGASQKQPGGVRGGRGRGRGGRGGALLPAKRPATNV